MPRAFLFAAPLAFFVVGCGAAIEPPRDASDNVVPVVERVKARDTFWMAQQAAEARRPEPERPRSISLGYVGQGKLAGGVGRDDIVEPHHPGAYGAMTWQQYVTAPNWRTNGGYQHGGRRSCRGCAVYGSTVYGAPSVPVGGSPLYR